MRLSIVIKRSLKKQLAIPKYHLPGCYGVKYNLEVIDMKLSEKMEKALNEQVKKEFYSAYLYLSMSAYCESLNYSGFANWLKKQAQEEMEHAMKLYDYIFERRGRVILEAIDKPPSDWKDLVDVFENVLKHEEEVTESIYKLMDLAKEEKDYATESMLKWFVDEQVEEEASADEILQKLRMVGDNKNALFSLDRALSQR